MDQPGQVIQMPGLREIVAKAGTTVLLTSLVPSAIFYVVLTTAGLRTAVWVTLAWYYGMLLLQWMGRRPVWGAALLGAGLLTIRTIVTTWTGSAFLYFLQPVAGTVATAVMLAVTALAGRPLMDRLVHDFCPLPSALSHQLRARRYFHYISGVWAVAYLVNAAGTVWLLSNSSIGGFLVLKSVLSPALTGLTVAVSFAWFRLVLRRHGVALTWRQAAFE